MAALVAIPANIFINRSVLILLDRKVQVEYNIYYNPEVFGLETVAEIDYSDGNYQFNIRVVWRRLSDRKLFTSRDSGYSYPTPFEDETLETIEPFDYETIRREVLMEVSEGREWQRTPSSEQTYEFLRKLWEVDR